MGQYGRITTTDSIAKQLKKYNTNYEGRKTWDQLYGAVGLSTNQALEQAQYDYYSAMNDAYAAAYNEAAAVQNSALAQGYKTKMLSDLDYDLNEAFNSYRQNYLTQKQNIESTAAEAKATVDSALLTQAKNVKAYADSPYQYLTTMFNRAYGNEDYEPDSRLLEVFEKNPNWSKYVVENEGQKSLLSEQELYKQLYDKDGNLTIKGADFYDQMMNDLGVTIGEEYSFHNWLANENSELFEWSQSYNPYDYNPDLYGNSTNMSGMKTMFGMTSDDETYQFVERYAGMSEGELSEVFSRYDKAVSDFATKVSEDSGRHSKEIIGDINTMVSEIKEMANQLGIQGDVEEELGFTFDQLTDAIKDNYDSSESNGAIWWKNILAYLGATHTGATTGWSQGGAWGAAIGASIGHTLGTAISILGSEQMKNKNSELANESSKQFQNLVVQMTKYAQNERRKTEIEYNKRKTK